MDEMNIISKFMTNILSKIITKVVKKKLGYNIELNLKSIKATVVDDKVQLSLDIDAEMNKQDFMHAIKDYID